MSQTVRRESAPNYPHGRNTIYVFIDAFNLWQAEMTKGKFLDYVKTIGYIKSLYDGTTVSVFYYAVYPADSTRTYSVAGKHKYLTFLKKGLGFIIRKKPLKRITVVLKRASTIQEKGSMDVEMTIDAVHNCGKLDTAVFFTGDSDFLALVAYLRERGKKVYVCSSRNNISRELKEGADGYVDLLDVPEDIWGRPLTPRVHA
ncbi:MAG: hypothetical protein QOG91_245 [Candidatus Parcubacteria bacterium]|jgi:uncharacterized LabA/DUF88 family protein|nr:hypothetical protein [Candidatus Parcubacteria bacterium]